MILSFLYVKKICLQSLKNRGSEDIYYMYIFLGARQLIIQLELTELDT